MLFFFFLYCSLLMAFTIEWNNPDYIYRFFNIAIKIKQIHTNNRTGLACNLFNILNAIVKGLKHMCVCMQFLGVSK